MKELEFALSKQDLLEDFFEKAQLFGIVSEKPAHFLSNVLNKKLDLGLRAAPELTLQMKFNNDFGAAGLFSDFTAFFSIYKSDLSPCTSEIYLYCNKFDQYSLLPKYEYFNYLMLVKNEEMLLFDDSLDAILSNFPVITNIVNIPITPILAFENLFF